MFTEETRQITRRCELTFLVDLREENEAPIRANRGAKSRTVPRAVTVEEGPFSFTLLHSVPRSQDGEIELGLEVTRRAVSGDPSLDCEQRISGFEYGQGGPDGDLSDWGSASLSLGIGKGSETSTCTLYTWEELKDLYGEEEPVVATMTLSFDIEAKFTVARTSAGRLAGTALNPLESLATFVSNPRPNDVAFILASAPFRPLYSNRAILAAASPYFQNYFDPPAHVRRASGAIKRTVSFVDDSDAESHSGDDDDLEMLVPPEQLGTQRSKRKSPQKQPFVKEESSSPSKKKKTNSSSRDANADEAAGGVVEIHIDDGSRTTMQAILVYLLCGRIEFAPLSTQGRDEYVREYGKMHPERPKPVSPRSVYRLAVRFELASLQELALTHLAHSFTLESAVREALTDDCFHFSAYCSIVHDLVVKEWARVQTMPVWKETLKKAGKGDFSHSNTLLPKLLIRGSEAS